MLKCHYYCYVFIFIIDLIMDYSLLMILPSTSHGKYFLSAEVITVQMIQQVFQGNQSLCIHQTPHNSGYVISLSTLQLQEKNNWIQASLQ